MNCMNKQEANNKANMLLNKMTSDGWGIKVWCNISWCYAIYKGTVSITEHKDINNEYYYSILMGTENHSAGECFWLVNKTFTDPNKAYEEQINKAEQYVEYLKNCINKSI